MKHDRSQVVLLLCRANSVVLAVLVLGVIVYVTAGSNVHAENDACPEWDAVDQDKARVSAATTKDSAQYHVVFQETLYSTEQKAWTTRPCYKLGSYRRTTIYGIAR